MFKKNFVWGVATSSYQIEGAYNDDGRGLSIWDTFCRQDGRIYQGHTGDVACNHYNEYKNDVALMKKMGIKAYRFSVSWSRILPEGIGIVNQKGIDFYNNLINELITVGIEPYMTLHHWDYPQELFNKGGWMNPDSPKWFAEYAKVIAENFGDRVKNYMTFNEPQVIIGLGYLTGEHAPGYKLALNDAVIMSHNILLAHGLSVCALRDNASQKINVGFAPTYQYAYPSDENDENDIDVARELNFNMKKSIFAKNNWAWNMSWWCDPIVFGNYPEEGLELYKKYLPKTWKEDMKIICQPLDFLGQNLYNGYEVKHNDDNGYNFVEREPGSPKTAMNWPITPKAIKWCVKFAYERYSLPIYITENGLASNDFPSADGKVHDPIRIEFLRRYLKELKSVAKDGAEVAGYFHWSFMDNFEWAHGYNERFGLVYVDFMSQKRVLKDSAYWYKDVITSNGDLL